MLKQMSLNMDIEDNFMHTRMDLALYVMILDLFDYTSLQIRVWDQKNNFSTKIYVVVI